MKCPVCDGKGIEEWGDSSGHPQHSQPCPKCSREVSEDMFREAQPGDSFGANSIAGAFRYGDKFFLHIEV